MDTFIIRKAEQKDVAGIISLLKQVAEVHHKIRPDIFKSGATKYDEEELAKIIAEPSTPVFVYEEGGKVLAHAFCKIKEVKGSDLLVDEKTLFIDDLCVDEGARGRGVGKKTFAFLKEYAVKVGCNVIKLAVWAGNDRAERFYRALGMKDRETMMELYLQN